MHEGIYGDTALILKNKEECTGYLTLWKAHYRSGGTPKLRRLEMKSVEDFPEFLRWRNLNSGILRKKTGGTSEIEFGQGGTENHGHEVCEQFSRTIIGASSPS
jgi:hypothetical protein